MLMVYIEESEQVNECEVTICTTATFVSISYIVFNAMMGFTNNTEFTLCTEGMDE